MNRLHETFHVKCLKKLHKLNKNAANWAVHGDLGRFKLMTTVECRMIGFWCMLLNGNRSNLSFLMFSLLENHKGVVGSDVKANLI